MARKFKRSFSRKRKMFRLRKKRSKKHRVKKFNGRYLIRSKKRKPRIRPEIKYVEYTYPGGGFAGTSIDTGYLIWATIGSDSASTPTRYIPDITNDSASATGMIGRQCYLKSTDLRFLVEANPDLATTTTDRFDIFRLLVIRQRTHQATIGDLLATSQLACTQPIDYRQWNVIFDKCFGFGSGIGEPTNTPPAGSNITTIHTVPKVFQFKIPLNVLYTNQTGSATTWSPPLNTYVLFSTRRALINVSYQHARTYYVDPQ